MEFFITSLPTWVSATFLISFPIIIFLIANTVKNAAINANWSGNRVNNIYKNVILFFVGYLLYTSLMALFGAFAANALPPRVLIFTAFPLLVFLFAYVFRATWYWELLKSADLSQLIQIHIFRFVGVFFLIAYYYEALPMKFAFIAAFGDILTAFAAIFVSKWVKNPTSKHKKIALIWNIFGFWDMVSVVITAFLSVKYAMIDNSIGMVEMGKFPFAWIPAIAPAIFVFLHITIFKKLKMVE